MLIPGLMFFGVLLVSVVCWCLRPRSKVRSILGVARVANYSPFSTVVRVQFYSGKLRVIDTKILMNFNFGPAKLI